MKQALQDTICPKCKDKLNISSSQFFCPQCNKSYPVINGIPILLNEKHSMDFENIEQIPSVKLKKLGSETFYKSNTDPQCSTATQANVKYLAAHLGPSSKLLFVGGGIHSFGESYGKAGSIRAH